MVNFPEHAPGGQHPERLAVLLKPLVHSDRQHTAGFPRGLHRALGFSGIERKRLFQDHVLSCLQRLDRERDMEFVRDSDIDRIHGRVGQQLLRGRIRAGNLERLAEFVQAFGMGVVGRDDAPAGVGLDRFCRPMRDGAGADKTE